MKRKTNRYRKFNRAVRTTKSIAQTAHTALKVALAVKKLVNVEYKIKDYASSVTPDNAGDVYSITHCGQGTDKDDRTGDSIRAKQHLIRLRATINGSATVTTVMYIIFMDRHQNGTPPTVTELLQNASLVDPVNDEYGKRFKVIRRGYINLSSTGMQTGIRKLYIKHNNVVKYDGAGATTAEQKENNMYMLLLSNEATNTPTVDYYVRFRFIDN